MASHPGPSASKTSNVATFSSEVSAALKATQDLQDNVHKLLQTFSQWSSHESEASLTKVRETIKDIQSCQRFEYFNLEMIKKFKRGPIVDIRHVLQQISLFLNA